MVNEQALPEISLLFADSQKQTDASQSGFVDGHVLEGRIRA